MQKLGLILVIPLLAVGLGYLLVELAERASIPDRPTPSVAAEPRSYTWEEKQEAARAFRAYLEAHRACQKDADCVLVELACPVGECSTSVAGRDAPEVRHELGLVRKKYPCRYVHAVAPCRFTETSICQEGRCEVHREPFKR